MSRALFATSLLLSLAAAAQDDRALDGPLTLDLVTQQAIDRAPELSASKSLEAAARKGAEADGALPAPELMAEALAVPLFEPWRLDQGQMLSVGVKQHFPAPGVRGAMAEAKSLEADAETARRDAVQREVVRTVTQAYIDYAEALERHRTRHAHLDALARIVEVSQARISSGARLDDTLQAERDRARLEADVEADAAAVVRARSTLNGLLLRDPNAPLGEPTSEAAQTLDPAADLGALARAAKQRPESVQAVTVQRAQALTRRAREQEARWPGLSVGLSYFPPTVAMPMHGYGVRLEVELPWLWGKARSAAEAEALRSAALSQEIAAAAYRVQVEVTSNGATVRAAGVKWRALRSIALPAAKRAFETALASYRSGQGDVFALLSAQRAIAEVEVDLVMARSALDHALTDLDWALAQRAPRVSLEPKP